MTFEEYELAAAETAGDALSTDQIEKITIAALGLTGEAGEFADQVKKQLFHGHDVDRESLILEAGDVLWYIACAARALDCSLDEIAEKNLEKLQTRYPTGFSFEASRNRVV